MALVLADRVQQTGTANTTVSFTLSGTVASFQSFAVIGNTNTTFYAATDATGNWESGLGTYSTTGPTLTRTTVYASSNSGSAVTFSGTCNIFVTYPSGRSVNLDASGNVSALGTIASGTWNASTVPVAYGGTGVTASSGANSVMLRDASQNVAINRLNQSNTNTAAAAGITTLTAASSYSQTLTGTGTQTFKMPDATTLTTGVAFIFNNNATGTLTLQDSASGAIGTITAGGAVELVCVSTATVAGTWDYHGFLPENVTWGTNALALGSTVITGGTWNGGTIPTGYGGTGLTTFTAANGALYSTSSSALAAGTLPVAAGGTGASSAGITAFNNITGYSAAGATGTTTTNLVFSTSPTLVTPVLGTPQSGTLTSCTGLPLTTGVTGTLGIANGGTGQTTAATAFNALSPLTTLGDTLYGAASGAGTRLAGNTTATKKFLVQTGTGTVSAAPAWGTIAAGDVPTLNQSTTGSAATLTTARAIYGNNFNGSAALTQIIASTYGGTGNGFTAFSGPATSEKTFTLPNASATILTSNAAVTVAQGGTGVTTTPTNGQLLVGNGTNYTVATLGSGTGISTTTGAGTLTVNNTGVTSNVAGTGITVSGATGAVTISIGQAVATSSNVQFNSLGVGTAGSATAGEIRATNNITAYYSDIRLKTKIGSIVDPLGKVRQIETMLYHANETAVELGYDASVIEVGLSAQSVQLVQPEAVAPAPIDDKYLTVRYERLVPLLLESVKALEDRIIELEAKLKG